MSNETKEYPPCPQCHSTDVLFSRKKHRYICEDCDHRWTAETPKDPSSSLPSSSLSPSKQKQQEQSGCCGGDSNGEEQLTTKKKIFLSYGRKDASDVAKRLCADLEHRGHTVWLDVKFMKSGESWEAQIEKYILNCDVFLSLLSPHAVRRPRGVCLDEISLARYADRPILPCMVVKCRPPLSIYRLEWVDLQQWNSGTTTEGDCYNRALDRIISFVEKQSQRSYSESVMAVDEFHSALFGSFQLLDFGREIARLSKDFIGRQWLLDDIDDWYNDTNNASSRVFLLTGRPGTGKSALAAQLVNKHPKVLAYHFCKTDLVESLNPSLFVRSIASQLGAQLPDYQEALAAVLHGSNKVYDSWDASTQFRRLIVDPLQAESGSVMEPSLWVIDGLDASLEAADSQESLGGDNICQILSHQLVDLPLWIKVVATTRPNGPILDMFCAFGPQELDVSRTESRADIQMYLEQSISKLSLEPEDIIDPRVILDRTDGNFLSAVQEMESIRIGLSTTTKRKVYISHDRQDSAILAERLSNDLEARGYTVMINKQSSSKTSEAEVEEHIMGCDVFISLLSPHAVRRPIGVCLDEISLARYSDRMIVPCMVMRCRPPLSIYRLDMVDLQQWEQKAFYGRALDRVISVMEEGPENNVEGYHSAIFGSFKPLDFGREIVRLTKDFTGRQWLLDDVNEWYNIQSSSQVFLRTGRPGTGKSAFAAHLIHKHPKVLAYHFCISTLADSLDSSLFVRSIAAQLSTQLPDYCDALCALDLSQVNDWDASTQFRRLIVDPLKVESGTESMLWVIDALDESLERGVDSICELLSQRLVDLPPWVKLVVTTRSHPFVLDMLSQFKPKEIDVLQVENQVDIHTYLTISLGSLSMDRDVDVDGVFKALCERSEGNFLYAVQAIAALQTGLIDPKHPEQFPTGLVGIYRSFFTRSFPSKADFNEIRPLLDVIVTAQSYLDATRIAAATKLDSLDVQQQLTQVSCFFPLKDGKYVAYHKSIIDWLKGEVGHDPTYRVNVARGHEKLASYLKSLYESDDWDDFVLNHYFQHLIHCQRWADLKQVTCYMDFLKEKVETLGWNQVQYDFLVLVDVIPRRQAPAWFEDVRAAITSQIEDPQEQFVWSRLISSWLNRSGVDYKAESIKFDLQGGKITDMLFARTLKEGKTFEALCFAENSSHVYWRSGLFQQAADIAHQGEESAKNGLPEGPVSDLLQIQLLDTRARSIRNLHGDQVALPHYLHLQQKVATLSWGLTIDELQSLEYDVPPLPRTASSLSLPEDHPFKVQIICNTLDALNAIYVIRWLEEKGARVDWRHHSDSPPPQLVPMGYKLSIILGGPLSPGMFNYNVEFQHLPGFMDLYRVDKTDAYGVYKMTRNDVLCCLAAGSTKYLTTKGSITVTEDLEVQSLFHLRET